ncbi:protein dispatched homolog 1-like isoform X2 [Babylonia areolata]|uniref:protein dispatched homolog 1-like isoform X2 n=1 Tax=Babylonia areolata TaxID=304850 RepID=UPI003FD58326
MGFARILAHYPYVVLLVVLVVTATCLVVSITIPRRLDFSQPTAGFEPRGTELSKRIRTYQSIIHNYDKRLNLQPSEVTRGVGSDARDRSFDGNLDAEGNDGSGEEEDEEQEGRSSSLLSEQNLPWKVVARNYFCGLPHKDYVRVMYKSTDGSSLLSAKTLRTICQLEEEYYDKFSSYTSMCESRHQEDHQCCRRLSLPNFVALLAKKTSCHNITDGDIGKMFRLLSSCAGYYHNLTLGPACGKLPKEKVWYGGFQNEQESCPGVPRKCTARNLVYNVLHYLVDHKFLSRPAVPRTNPPLTYVATFLPVAASEYNIGLYQHLEKLPRVYKGVEIAGAYFNVKDKLFEQNLVGDSVWLGLAGGFIFLAMWVYTASIFVTFMTFLSIFWALVTAYFLYTFVFEINFFPYMNMIAVVIMIGIGTDDLFVYCKVWHLAKSEKNNGVLEKIICDTLRHSVLSMLVTSLTTAAAFYANYISDITAIRCFSIYAGTSVICNFVLTITWMPASIMLYEKWCNFYMCQRAEVYTGEFSICYCICKVPYKLYYLISDWSRVFFEQILPCLVIKLRYLWLFLYGCLGICAVVVIFYYPRLRLPSSKKFQVFSSDHLLEKYDFHLRNVFGFEMMNEEDTPTFPITIVWGVHPTDYGDYLDPRDRGALAFDSEFDLSAADSQVWVLDFCRRLRRTEFYQATHGMQLTNCFLENFVNRYMKRPCSSRVGNSLCCNNTVFPYPKEVFMECLMDYMRVLPKTPGVHYSQHSPGPRFHDGRVTALIVQFQSVERYNHNYQHVQAFYRRVNQWVTEEMLRAPKEMRYGWFVSYLDFYDLQHSLVSGTPMALGVSLAVVALVTFFTTLNALVSLYALVTIACIIMVTLASLVLLGWELNILESVVITVAIGMSIDYTLHYAVAYRLAPDLDREMRVASSISRMGSPVAMAAVTTFAAGAFLMPSTVLVYRKFGTFLMLLVSVGWVYSTFFFQSLLRLMGPQGGFGQFHWPASDCCGPSSRERVDKTIYAFSESTLSSSSANHASSTETHELEPLTDLHDSSPRLISHHPIHHCPAHHHTHHHHHHHHHRPRSRGQYTPVRTDIAESRGLNSRVEEERSTSVPKREPVVSFESPKCAHKERNESERTCSVSEADSGVALAHTDQSPTCAAQTSSSSSSQLVCQSPVVTPLRPVSADLSSHEGFPQAVQVL